MAKTPAPLQRFGRVGQRPQVVIPRDMLETMNLREGDFVAFEKHTHGVLIKAKPLGDDDTVLTPGEARLVRRGEAQLKRGESKPWRVVKDELAL